MKRDAVNNYARSIWRRLVCFVKRRHKDGESLTGFMGVNCRHCEKALHQHATGTVRFSLVPNYNDAPMNIERILSMEKDGHTLAVEHLTNGSLVGIVRGRGAVFITDGGTLRAVAHRRAQIELSWNRVTGEPELFVDGMKLQDGG